MWPILWQGLRLFGVNEFTLAIIKYIPFPPSRPHQSVKGLGVRLGGREKGGFLECFQSCDEVCVCLVLASLRSHSNHQMFDIYPPHVFVHSSTLKAACNLAVSYDLLPSLIGIETMFYSC
eukprot:TRINITY_DN9362_c0_g1_i1.p2 TRINITY_DN9362_c0_g1~~TRINITY_DN9362_c0_g1_i1.p2  ORF type:complete len:120 (-),score=6.82 TRINITY_DN9362_c0_g1_i1:25-384(-)